MISLASIAIQYPFIRRKRLGEITQIYWGFVWGDYHREAVKCIVDYFDCHKEFERALKWTKIPEELAFQTILMNDEVQKTRLVNKTLRFWNWSRGDNSGPPYLIESDLEDIDSTEAIFARKVKANTDVLILHKNRLQNQSGGLIDGEAATPEYIR